jgi:DNA-binding MarR family transcriptional regulator
MPSSKASKKKPLAHAAEQDAAQQSAFNQLINENALLFFRMKVVAQEVHQQGEMSGGKRSLLRLLSEAEAQTVPQISRARNVTRQHTQTLINELADEGLVDFFDNPGHKRSPFVQLTAQGQRAVAAMERREAKLHTQMPMHVPENELRAAARTLRKLRAEFEGEPWRRLLKQFR